MASRASNVDKRKVEIETTRLVLRAAKAGDELALNEAFSDPEVMRYWSEPPHRDIERTREWIGKMMNGSQNGVTDFIICLKPDLSPIGKIGVWQDEEIGFLLARSQWGKGLAQEALQVVLSYLFNDKGFAQLTADIDPRNAASRKLLNKVGFEEYDFKEKTFEINGEWVDSQYLKLTKNQFNRKSRNGRTCSSKWSFGDLITVAHGIRTRNSEHKLLDLQSSSAFLYFLRKLISTSLTATRRFDMPSYERFQSSGRTPLRTFGPQPTYQTYISPYGPKTKHLPNFWGFTIPKTMRYGSIVAGMGVAAGTFAIFFFGEIPKVRKDILQKVPIIGDYFVREIPPEDNPF